MDVRDAVDVVMVRGAFDFSAGRQSNIFPLRSICVGIYNFQLPECINNLSIQGHLKLLAVSDEVCSLVGL